MAARTDLAPQTQKTTSSGSEPPASARFAADGQLESLLVVLNHVRERGVRSRPEIIRSTGLSRAVVDQRTAELLDRRLLVEGAPGTSTGGRAPRQL